MQNIVTIQNKRNPAVCRVLRAMGILLTAAALAGCEQKTALIWPEDEQTDAVFTEATAQNAQTGADASAEQASSSAQPEAQTIAVHVCGAVVREDVYELDAGARVIDAVRAAGGFTEDADTSFVNQAAFLTDGMRLRIPTAEEAAALKEEGASSLLSDELAPETVVTLPAGARSALVNINTATAAELCGLNGVGEARAAEIIRYRETHGAFTQIEDLMKVTGIKEKLFERIRDSITV